MNIYILKIINFFNPKTMKTLQIDEATARKIYPTAAPELRSILEESFTKEFFKQKITDIVKSFEDGLKFRGVSAESVFKSYDTAQEVADKKVKFLAKIYKNGFKAKWEDGNQKKWYCVFVWDSKKSAFVFARTDCYWTYTFTYVGSRLSFPDQETAVAFGTTFIDLINETLVEEND